MGDPISIYRYMYIHIHIYICIHCLFIDIYINRARELNMLNNLNNLNPGGGGAGPPPAGRIK